MSEREPKPNKSPAQPGASDEPHDVLAAEEFPGPSPEDAIHEQRPIELPADPHGDEPPHDVLAAEEFAMPAPRHHADTSVEVAAPAGPSRTPLLVGLASTALGALAFALKRRSRRRSKVARLRDRLPLP
jgi:hypothetical protein